MGYYILPLFELLCEAQWFKDSLCLIEIWNWFEIDNWYETEADWYWFDMEIIGPEWPKIMFTIIANEPMIVKKCQNTWFQTLGLQRSEWPVLDSIVLAELAGITSESFSCRRTKERTLWSDGCKNWYELQD